MAALGAEPFALQTLNDREGVEPGGYVAIPRMAAIRRMFAIPAIHDRFAKPLA